MTVGEAIQMFLDMDALVVLLLLIFVNVAWRYVKEILR